ncbi:EamA family transporter [Saprospira sp. CCB-QB6]|uniref:DMT family transporter n=1 Tax=Saprospira sp. CCB-QB6 TaxID=3023936 RepID=UPI00234A77CB|nr:EamA family transporter [Saprospira sp. CCB-QB6]WCL82900.1 EamA family transporter [Saprospira sp. CCB-QB6]
MTKTDSRKAFIALALVSFFWGTTYLATRIGVKEAHGLFLSSVRQCTAGVSLIAFMWARGAMLPKGKALLHTIIIGLMLLGAGNALMTWALQYVESGFASVVSASGPIFIALFSHFMIRPLPWSPKLIGGMALGMLGILGVFSNYLDSFDQSPNFSLGLLIMFGATLFWSLGSVFAAKWKPDTSLLMGAGLQMFSGGLFTAIICSFFSWDQLVFGELSMQFWGSILYLVVFGSFIAYSAYIYVMEHLPPTQAALSAYINPIVAVIAGALVLGERLTWLTLIGMLLTILGVYLVNQCFKTANKKMTAAAEEVLELDKEVV